MRLRELAWELEKTGTGLCVAPALLDVAGPRTSIRPVAGLPLLHMDPPEFNGGKPGIKAAFDKVAAVLRWLCCAAVRGRRADHPAERRRARFFRQTRVGKDGREFTSMQVPDMVVDAETLKAGWPRTTRAAGCFQDAQRPAGDQVGAGLRR